MGSGGIGTFVDPQNIPRHLVLSGPSFPGLPTSHLTYVIGLRHVIYAHVNVIGMEFKFH